MPRRKRKKAESFLLFSILFTIPFIIGFHQLAGFSLEDIDEMTGVGDLVAQKRRYAAYAILTVLSVFFVSKNRSKTRKIFELPGIFLFFLISLSCFSVLWSDDPLLTARKFAIFCILFLSAFTINQRFNIEKIMKFVFIYSGLALLIGISAELRSGNIAAASEVYRFSGSLDPHGTALNCGLFMLSSFALLKSQSKRPIFLIFSIFIAIIVLFLTRARTGVFSLFFALIIAGIYTTKSKTKFRIFFVLLMCLLLTILFIGTDLLNYTEEAVLLGRDQSEVETLTGRIPLWKGMLKFVAERPIVGHGFQSFWTEDRMLDFRARENWIVGSGHSAYFDILLDLGILGAAAYVLVLSSSIRIGIRRSRTTGKVEYAYAAAILIMFSLAGILSSVVVVYPGSQVFVPLVIIIHMSTARYRGLSPSGELHQYPGEQRRGRREQTNPGGSC